MNDKKTRLGAYSVLSRSDYAVPRKTILFMELFHHAYVDLIVFKLTLLYSSSSSPPH
jgi:hypothetical protein